jgi:hypothetical protein
MNPSPAEKAGLNFFKKKRAVKLGLLLFFFEKI